MEGHVIAQSCRFCSIGRGYAGEPYDVPVARTADHFAIASVGALVPGWVLICPRAHTTNMADLYDDSQSVDLRLRVSEILRARYGLPVRLFEHGANCAGSTTGCGVDHAHSHLVPLGFSLLEDIHEFDRTLTWIQCKASEIRRVASEREYLFASDNASAIDPDGFLALVPNPTSQFFRKLIATKLARESEFNYRTHPNIQNTMATVASLSESD